jgi:hypothetical protein
MPANPKQIARREVLSEDYHDEKVHIDFYTNSAIRIYRADKDANAPDDEAVGNGKTVWLDNLEKRELLKILKEEV